MRPLMTSGMLDRINGVEQPSKLFDVLANDCKVLGYIGMDPNEYSANRVQIPRLWESSILLTKQYVVVNGELEFVTWTCSPEDAQVLLDRGRMISPSKDNVSLERKFGYGMVSILDS